MHVKYKIFLSAMEYLPFSSEDDSKGNFEDIIERYVAFLFRIYENFTKKFHALISFFVINLLGTVF